MFSLAHRVQVGKSPEHFNLRDPILSGQHGVEVEASETYYIRHTPNFSSFLARP
jgi:hypothetical protein